jgi:hypothetical protein
MKMNVQNPGGEEVSHRRMKGNEKYMRKGKGSVYQGEYLQTHAASKARGLSGHVQAGGARGK